MQNLQVSRFTVGYCRLLSFTTIDAGEKRVLAAELAASRIAGQVQHDVLSGAENGIVQSFPLNTHSMEQCVFSL